MEETHYISADRDFCKMKYQVRYLLQIGRNARRIAELRSISS